MSSNCIPFDSVILEPLTFDLRSETTENYQIPFVGVHVIPYFIENEIFGYKDAHKGLEQLDNWEDRENMKQVSKIRKLKQAPIDWVETIQVFKKVIPRSWGFLSQAATGRDDLWSSSICDFLNHLKNTLKPDKLSVIVGHGNFIGNLLRIAEYSSNAREFKVLPHPEIPNGVAVKMTLKSGSDTWTCLLVRHCLTHHNLHKFIGQVPQKPDFTQLTTCADTTALKNARYYINELLLESGMPLNIYASPTIRAIETALGCQGSGLEQNELTSMTKALREPQTRSHFIDEYRKKVEAEGGVIDHWNQYVKNTKSIAIELSGQRIPTSSDKTRHFANMVEPIHVSHIYHAPEKMLNFDTDSDDFLYNEETTSDDSSDSLQPVEGFISNT
jgi:broad specificity phosphatase PhoE